MYLDIENIGIDTSMLVLGAIEQEIWQNYGHFGAILEINMAATNCWGLFFLMIYRY